MSQDTISKTDLRSSIMYSFKLSATTE